MPARERSRTAVLAAIIGAAAVAAVATAGMFVAGVALRMPALLRFSWIPVAAGFALCVAAMIIPSLPRYRAAHRAAATPRRRARPALRSEES